MSILYLDCSMGAAGDMLAGALLDICPNPKQFWDFMHRLPLPNVIIGAKKETRTGIEGVRFLVKIEGQQEEDHIHDSHAHHTHHAYSSILELVDSFDIPLRVKENIQAVYKRLAEAESAVHGTPISDIHFHEVGTLDAVADITAVCLLLYLLNPSRILASPICVGSGYVHTAHGILPVPAPATARLLQGIPIYAGTIASELCTPTGAALLSHFVSEFLPVPAICAQKIGYGLGKKEFVTCNAVRAFWAEEAQSNETVVLLSCNIDDQTPEQLAYACEVLRNAGAFDIWTTSIQMKKGRMGYLLSVLCAISQKEAMYQLLFKHTPTLGVREQVCTRRTLPRYIEQVQTYLGTVNVKQAEVNGIHKYKAEYEDLAHLAQLHDLPISSIEKEVEKTLVHSH